MRPNTFLWSGRNIVFNFLNDEKKEITINKLQIEVWGHKSKLDTHTVETHVYRLRKKVESKFKDKSFIVLGLCILFKLLA